MKTTNDAGMMSDAELAREAEETKRLEALEAHEATLTKGASVRIITRPGRPTGTFAGQVGTIIGRDTGRVWRVSVDGLAALIDSRDLTLA